MKRLALRFDGQYLADRLDDPGPQLLLVLLLGGLVLPYLEECDAPRLTDFELVG